MAITEIRAIVVINPEDCIARTCDCDPGECEFDECPHCGHLVQAGMTVDPRGCCFYCKAD